MHKFSKKIVPYVFLFPFLCASAVFTFIPVCYSLYISLHEFSFLNVSNSAFVGLENYKDVFSDPVFRKALLNSVKYLFAIVPSLIIISLLLAVLLNSKIKCRAFFRSAFYLPYVVSPVAMGVVAVQLFAKDNFIVQFTKMLGMKGASWHTMAPYAFWLVVIVVVWSQIGFYMVLYLTGLQNIPSELYEASAIDGANKFQQFFRITVPQLSNTTILVLFMTVLNTLQLYDHPYVISSTGLATPGSPGDTTLTMVMYLYNRGFRYREFGPASAAAFIVFCIIFVFTVLQNVITKKVVKE